MKNLLFIAAVLAAFGLALYAAEACSGDCRESVSQVSSSEEFALEVSRAIKGESHESKCEV